MISDVRGVWGVTGVTGEGDLVTFFTDHMYVRDKTQPLKVVLEGQDVT